MYENAEREPPRASANTGSSLAVQNTGSHAMVSRNDGIDSRRSTIVREIPAGTLPRRDCHPTDASTFDLARNPFYSMAQAPNQPRPKETHSASSAHWNRLSASAGHTVSTAKG